MLNRMICLCLCIVLFSSCQNEIKSKTYKSLSIEKIKNKYSYLQDNEITELGYLIRTEWNEQGDGVKIFCLNDVAEYEAGPVIEFKFEDELFKPLCLNGEMSKTTRNFIMLSNSNTFSRPNPLVKYKVEDLVITLSFSNSETVEFKGFYDLYNANIN